MTTIIKVFSEQDSKADLLGEVHRLQNCLGVSRIEYEAMCKARDFHGANSADLMRERDRPRESEPRFFVEKRPPWTHDDKPEYRVLDRKGIYLPRYFDNKQDAEIFRLGLRVLDVEQEPRP